MPACAISPADKRALATLVGDDLLRHYGKQPYYTVDEVSEARRRQGVDLDLGCWAHALFNSPADFARQHRELGEACDYVSMHRAMLEALSEPGSAGAEAGSWLDLSWVDLSAIFDGFDAL